MHGHAKSETRNLRLHHAAFEKLRDHPHLVAAAVALIDRWTLEGVAEASREALAQWRAMLTEWPLEDVATLVLDVTRGEELRQCSPLAPALSPRERWAVLRALRDELGDESAPTEAQ